MKGKGSARKRAGKPAARTAVAALVALVVLLTASATAAGTGLKDPSATFASLRARYSAAQSLKGGALVAAMEPIAAKAAELMAVYPLRAEGFFIHGVAEGSIGAASGLLKALRGAKIMKADLEQALELDPRMADAYTALSIVYRKVPPPPISFGSKRKAVELAEKAVSLAPEVPGNRRALAEAYLATGQRAKAEVQLTAMVRIRPAPGDSAAAADIEWARVHLR